MEKHHKFSIWYILLAFWLVLIIQNYIATMMAVQTIPYSQFLKLVKDGKVTEVAITENQIQGTMTTEKGNRNSGPSGWTPISPISWNSTTSPSRDRSSRPLSGTSSPGSCPSSFSSPSGTS